MPRRKETRKIQVNDIVRNMNVDIHHIDAFARVTEVHGKYIRVSNMNMPFQGTMANEILYNGDWIYWPGYRESLHKADY